MPITFSIPPDALWIGQLLAVLGVSGFVFFTFTRNALLKRRIWPVFNVVVGLLTLAVALRMGIPVSWKIAFVPILLLIVAYTIRTTRFCDACGATLRSQPVFRDPVVCRKCGTPLGAQRLLVRR